MKAVILAGGRGSRGKPYTDYFPKAMTPINGRPLIDYLVRYLDSSRIISQIIIVADFKGLGGQIKNYFENYSKSKIIFVQDSQSGTAGDLLHLKNILKDESEFLLWFVDNLCAINLKQMLQFFKNKKSSACIAIRSKRREETGFAMVEDNIIKKFMEKPIVELPMAECLGIYILGNDILQKIQQKSKQKHINLSYDILEELSVEGKVSGYDIGDKQWLDVESPTVLERNKEQVKQIIKQMGL